MPQAKPLRELTSQDQERFWAKVDVRGPEECWPWLASTFQKTGYGQFGLSPRVVLAHRVAFKLVRGYEPDPELKLDHTCRLRICCNPAHLRVKTDAGNIQAGMAPSSILAREGRCAQGHDLRITGAWRKDKGKMRLRCQVCKRGWNAARPSRARS